MSFNLPSLIVMQHIQFNLWWSSYVYIVTCFLLLLSVLSKNPMKTEKLILDCGEKSSIIRQKGESQNGGNKKTRHANCSHKKIISYPLKRTRKFGVLCFLVTSFLRFALFPYYRQNDGNNLGGVQYLTPTHTI